MSEIRYHNYISNAYKKKPKLLVIGHGRHGKDTVCEILRDSYGYNFTSSSQFCSKLFIFDALKDKYGYATEEECYADRHNHRAEWYNAICEYNVPDAAKLGKAIFKEYNIYCGLRNKKEYHAMRNTKVFDYVIWVDRSDHLPLEDKTSMTLEPWMADFVIDNNGSVSDLELNIAQLAQTLNPY
jgi:dephospho-CoA kinase